MKTACSPLADRTPPPGRDPGTAGALAASRNFRTAVPGLSCTVEPLIVAGDRHGRGQPVDFMATDIYRIADGRIAENWHLEDNLTLLGQLGVVTP